MYTETEQAIANRPMNCSHAIHISWDLFRITAKGMKLAITFGDDGWISEIQSQRADDPRFEQEGDDAHHLFTVPETDELRDLCLESKISTYTISN